MNVWELVATVVVAVLGSNGLWSLIQSKSKTKNARDELIKGIAYRNIVDMAEMYIDRGEISTEEYNDLDRYMFKPYKKMGGDGTAEKLMKEVEKLPQKKQH